MSICEVERFIERLVRQVDASVSAELPQSSDGAVVIDGSVLLLLRFFFRPADERNDTREEFDAFTFAASRLSLCSDCCSNLFGFFDVDGGQKDCFRVFRCESRPTLT